MDTTKPKPKPATVDPEDPALVLTFADLDDIGRLCHKNLSTREGLIAAIQELTTVSVEGCVIALEPKLLSRLKSRCLYKERFPEWLAEIIIKQLHDYAGW